MMIFGIYTAIGAALYLTMVLAIEPAKKLAKKHNVNSDSLNKSSDMLDEIVSYSIAEKLVSIIFTVLLWPLGILYGIKLILEDSKK